MSDRYIEIDSVSLSSSETEVALGQLLKSYGISSTPDLRQGGKPLVLTDAKGVTTRITLPELIAQLHLTGTCEIDRLRWLDTDPYGGTIALEAPEGLPVVIATGFRNSPPLQGPGFATNDVVTELLDDILFYRAEVAAKSSPGDMYKSSFRAYRSYLASSISAIDAYVNRLSWFARNDPASQLTPTDTKLLSRKNAPLDEKLRRWLPVLADGARLSEQGPEWTDYQALKSARNATVHVNEPEFIFAPRDATNVLNLCRRGVGVMLTRISSFLNRHPSQAVLRVARAPLAKFNPHI